MRNKYALIWAILIFCLQNLIGQNIPHVNFIGPYDIQVNTYNGNLYIERSDFVIPNPDLSIDFSFHFNSLLDTIDIGYGKGWRHSYSIRCEPYEQGMVIERANGRRDSFPLINTQYKEPPGIHDRLFKNVDGYFNLETKFGVVYRFLDSIHHFVTEIETPNGILLRLSYSDSLLHFITDNSGRIVGLSYSDGLLIRIMDNNFPGGRNWDFNYNSERLLTCVTNPMGDCKTYEYGVDGKMSAFYDELGNQVVINYDEKKRVAALETCLSSAAFFYNPEQFRTTVIEKNAFGDQTTTYVYNEEGKLIQKTGSCCEYDMSFTYDSDNNLSELIDANGNVSLFTYDVFGNAVITQDALSNKQEMTFGPFNRISSFIDKNGNQTLFEYDKNGNLQSMKQPLGIEMNFEHDKNGNLTRITDGEGNVTNISYNDKNEVIDINYPVGNEEYDYDEVGNLITLTDANGLSVNMEYDKLNRVVKLTNSLGDVIQYNYDPASNLKQEIDAKGNIKNYDYDAHNRLERVVTPIGETSYQYDALDNLTHLTNAEGNTSFFKYDTRSRLVSEEDAIGQKTFYEYDNNGNVVRKIDANFHETKYEFDSQNRLIRREYDGNIENFAYDANGNIILCNNKDITYSFIYDPLNRLIQKKIENWGLEVRYEYDRMGNRTRMIDPKGGVTEYLYDPNYRLVAIKNPFGEQTTFEYDMAGRVIRKQNHNGTYTRYIYDEANRLKAIFNRKMDNGILSSYEYEYDANGLRISMKDHSGGTASYSYDEENRLTEVTYTDGSQETYSFDKAGNRLMLTKNGETNQYQYDAANQIKSSRGISFDFDDNGNCIRKMDSLGNTLYHYDGDNKLIMVELPGGEKINYSYDPFGNRISRNHNEEVTRFFLDGDNVLMELDKDNEILVHFTAGLILDSWISMRQNGESFYYHKDALRSITGLSNGNQDLVNSYEYDIYGKCKKAKEEIYNPYQFTGRELESMTNMYYIRTRWYEPETGRFLIKDDFYGAIGRPVSLNQYIYVENSPVNYLDPSGKFIWNSAFGLLLELISQTSGNINNFGTNLSCYKYKFTWLDIIGGGKKLYDKIKIKHIKKGIKSLEEQIEKMHEFFSPGIGIHIRRFAKKVSSLRAEIEKLESQTKNLKNASDLIEKLTEINGISIDAIEFEFGGENCDELPKDNSGAQEDYENEEEIPDDLPPGEVPKDPRIICIPIIRSFDPNEIIGPEGVGRDKWVKQTATLPYTILFENDPDFATAAAQKVVITHVFDEIADRTSFRLGDFGFSNFYFKVPKNLSYYDTQIDLRDSLGIFLNVIAGIDPDLNQAFWVFESIDPATGLSTTLPATAGFLPVNDSLSRVGEGFVNFTIKPRGNSNTGEIIEAQASIIFDDNPLIATNITINTIDSNQPESTLVGIDTLGEGEYNLTWKGSDIGSGLADYIIFISKNGSSFEPIEELFSPTTNSYTFNGDPESTYRFFSLARDSVGYLEQQKAFGEPSCMIVSVDSIVNPNGNGSNGLIILKVEGNKGPVFYEWFHDPNLYTGSAEGLSAGNYRVIVRDSIGCEVGANINLQLLTSVTNYPEEVVLFSIFPVPARDQIHIQFQTEHSEVFLGIYDMQGRNVQNQQFRVNGNATKTLTVDLLDMPPGIYLLKLQSKSGYVTGIFTKL